MEPGYVTPLGDGDGDCSQCSYRSATTSSIGRAVRLDVEDFGLRRGLVEQVGQLHAGGVEGVFVAAGFAAHQLGVRPVAAARARRSPGSARGAVVSTRRRSEKIAVEGDLALVEHHDPTGQLLELGHVVAGDHHRHGRARGSARG